MANQEFRIRNGSVELSARGHAASAVTSSAPLLFIPGLWGQAEQFEHVIEAFPERPTYALSLRGRGKSDVPDAGYTLDDHASDIQAFADQMGLDRFFIATVSAGASYAISFAAATNLTLEGLILTDYPPISKSYPIGMVDGVLSDVRDLNISEKFLRGLQRESVARELVLELQRTRCRVTVFRGLKSGSYLTDKDIEFYRENLATFSLVNLEDVAHDPLTASQSYIEALRAIISK